MKTPREILFKRHQAVEPKLDSIRQATLAEAFGAADRPKPVRRLAPYRVCRAIWCELIWPCRRAWAGMAALWLMMWGIHVHLSDRQLIEADARPGSAPAIWQSIEDQREVLAQLLPPANSPPVELPRRSSPRPRSERLLKWQISNVGDEVTSLKYLCA